MAKEKKKGGILKEFKEFAVKGNMFDMAVGVIIGGAFQSLVKSLTDNILMPIVSVFIGGLSFSEWKVALGDKIVDGEKVVNYLTYGDFISAIINFIIMAFILFCLMRGINKLLTIGKKPEAPAAPTTKKCPYCKTEIDIEATRCPHCTSQLEK